MNRTLNINNINSIRNLLNKKAKILRTMPDDVDNQTATFNYTYDAIGNLIQDNTEGISAITWDVYGKIKMIDKGGSINDLYYGYDPMGNRIVKQDKLNKLISLKSGDNSKKTFYIRDASGNIMASYDVDVINYTEGQPLTTIVDYPMYGSSRVGEFHKQVSMSRINNAVWAGVAERYEYIVDAKDPKLHILREYGAKQYELSNHLGNVLVTTSDLRKGTDNNADGKADYYNAIVTTANDYYAFGSLMPGRQYNSSSYKFGFNGKENDNEIKGSGNQYDYGFRIYNPRLGKFLSVDPLTKSYPYYTPYQYAGNKPIWAMDLDGLEEYVMTRYIDCNGKIYKAVLGFSSNRENLGGSTMWVDNIYENCNGQIIAARTEQTSWMYHPEAIESGLLNVSRFPIIACEKLLLEYIPCGLQSIAANTVVPVVEKIDRYMQNAGQVGGGFEGRIKNNVFSASIELGTYSTSETNFGFEGKAKYTVAVDLKREIFGSLTSNVRELLPTFDANLYFYRQKNSYPIGINGCVIPRFDQKSIKNKFIGEVEADLYFFKVSTNTDYKDKISIPIFKYKYDPNKLTISNTTPNNACSVKLGLKNESSWSFNTKTWNTQ